MQHATGLARVRLPAMMLMATLLTPVVQAEMYKWVDPSGETHYTQTPPPAGRDYSTIKPPPPVDSSVMEKRLDKQRSYVSDSLKSKKEAAEQERIAAEEKALRQKNCQIGRKRLASYQIPGVSFVQPDGSRIRATEEQRQAEIKTSQDMIKEFCD